MSLYYEAASLITSLGNSQDASLKSLLFSKTKTDHARKSNPNQLYALITESWKWSTILKDVIEKASLLALEKKLSPELGLVLVHDLLLAKKGIAAPESHILRKAVERHKARLKAEFTKARIRSGCASVEQLRLQLGHQHQRNGIDLGTDSDRTNACRKWPHPRWLRINTLKADSQTILDEHFSAWQAVESLEQILTSQWSGSAGGNMYHIDEHVPNLLAFPPGVDLSSLKAYKQGLLISQDKASCFPAFLLSSGNRAMHSILDACAAPGNKTSHIAAISSAQHVSNTSQERRQNVKIYATERDLRRAEVLQKMLKIAGADHVQVSTGQDFLMLDPSSPPWNNISAIILDPSCSGSGIVDRGQTMTFDLPSVSASAAITNGNAKPNKKSKKRKRNKADDVSKLAAPKSEETTNIDINENEDDLEAAAACTQDAAALQTRLASLAALQTKMLIFAMSFPKVSTITYSTCSVHNIENENVVMAALASEIAMKCGWRVLRRAEQIDGLRRWGRRGDVQACRIAMDKHGFVDSVNVQEIADACIRCEPFTKEGTQGFFVAGFTRDSTIVVANGSTSVSDVGIKATTSNKDEDEVWDGFDD